MGIRTSRPRVLALTAAIATAGASMALLVPTAGASTVSGVVETRGIGTYAMPGPVGVVTTPGGTVAFSARIVNTGSIATSYTLTLSQTDFGVVQMLAGSTDITATAEGPGYLTPVVAPGKTLTFAITLTAPANADQTDSYGGDLQLLDANADVLSSAGFNANIEATGGSAPNDIYARTKGDPDSVIAQPNVPGDVFSEPIKPGGTAVYDISFRNDSATKTTITSQLEDFNACSVPFVHTAIANGKDVTAALAAGTYQTPVIAPGASSKLTITLDYPSPLNPSCDDDQGELVANAPGSTFAFVALNTFLAAN